MAKDRVPIPDGLAADVLFLADRTCCVCRNPQRKIQIHHIDEDPSRNELSNLATLCGDCHSDAHTTHAFARNLNALVIEKYNVTWRDIVRARLTMPSASEAEKVEYSAELLQEVQMNCLRWVNRLLHFVPEDFYPEQVNAYPWQTVLERGFPDYSAENAQRYARLFNVHSGRVADRMEQMVATFGDAIPVIVKLKIFRVSKSIRNEAHGYGWLVATSERFGEEMGQIYFHRRFMDTVEPLRQLYDLAEQQRELLFPEGRPPTALATI
jgi:hypothetical protein